MPLLLTCYFSQFTSHNNPKNLQFRWNFHLKFSESNFRMSFSSKSTITNEKLFPIFMRMEKIPVSTHAQLLEILPLTSNNFRIKFCMLFCCFWHVVEILTGMIFFLQLFIILFLGDISSWLMKFEFTNYLKLHIF